MTPELATAVCLLSVAALGVFNSWLFRQRRRIDDMKAFMVRKEEAAP